MADIHLTNRSQDGVRDGVHQGIGIRMSGETFGVWNFDAAEDKAATGDQLMHIVADANVDHGNEAKGWSECAKGFVKAF